MQGVSWVKYLRRIEVGDQPYGTKDEALHYVDLMPDGLHRQYTSIQECKSVVTTPSGGQVLLDKGFYNISGLAWSGRGKVKRVDVSVDGGRNWRTARLESPVLSKCLTRFNIDWVWDGKPALVLSRGDRRDRLRAAHDPPAARGARHAVDLPQQRHPVLAGAGERRGEQCPAGVACAGRRARAGLHMSRSWRRSRTMPASAALATPAEIAAWDIDVRPDFKGLPKGAGSVAQGMEVWEGQVRVLPRRVRREQRGLQPAGRRHDRRRHQDRPRRRASATRAIPGRTTLMKLSTVSTLWDYINRAMPWTAPKSLTPDEVYAVTAYMLNLGGIVPDDFMLSDRNIARGAGALPNRNGMTTHARAVAGRDRPASRTCRARAA